tara:strand:- start:96 stop:650 length:555 start_codon:yes stop_codon:yes gene_type:complete
MYIASCTLSFPKDNIDEIVVDAVHDKDPVTEGYLQTGFLNREQRILGVDEYGSLTDAFEEFNQYPISDIIQHSKLRISGEAWNEASKLTGGIKTLKSAELGGYICLAEILRKLATKLQTKHLYVQVEQELSHLIWPEYSDERTASWFPPRIAKKSKLEQGAGFNLSGHIWVRGNSEGNEEIPGN